MRKNFAELHKRTQSALLNRTAKNPLTVVIKSQNQGGFHTKIKIRNHTIDSDQPVAFEGANKGPKPSELILAALAACQETTWRIYGDSMGIEINDISIELRGKQDLRGFMGVDLAVPAGFLEIEGEVTIDSSATFEELSQLRKMVDTHCPVLDDLTRPVPVSLTLQKS